MYFHWVYPSSFCPKSSIDNFETIKDINLFARKLLFKSMYAKQTTKEVEVDPNLKAAHFRALQDLNLLLQVNESLDSM